ncbi:uncharacterized protein BO95DRAFT_430361 [Aspergillus brunneoviolaceus CBS 621.78]|uniref:Uncharacterized protein n=1 Tax=Aspergillus brunneoviolaceus CBS 621.78 TaxID=1450534 RepID=A0ACD1GDY4_9EURO|nr:hypothetical protein BO95DRAFT_430361 [Aspergillus brunneoviolaceus CBS 621.78]RAH47388.1 hypothetical protein BO95DRAFT_430361 [Aspergillus brunneoviolaceus CBS 621.78]
MPCRFGFCVFTDSLALCVLLALMPETSAVPVFDGRHPRPRRLLHAPEQPASRPPRWWALCSYWLTCSSSHGPPSRSLDPTLFPCTAGKRIMALCPRRRVHYRRRDKTNNRLGISASRPVSGMYSIDCGGDATDKIGWSTSHILEERKTGIW